MSLAQQPDDLKVTALNAAIRCLVAPLQLFGRVMGSEKNSTGHADDVVTANGHNPPQSISLAIFLQITEAKASIRKAYYSLSGTLWRRILPPLKNNSFRDEPLCRRRPSGTSEKT